MQKIDGFCDLLVLICLLLRTVIVKCNTCLLGANSPYLKVTSIKESTIAIFLRAASHFTENLETFKQ